MTKQTLKISKDTRLCESCLAIFRLRLLFVADFIVPDSKGIHNNFPCHRKVYVGNTII